MTIPHLRCFSPCFLGALAFGLLVFSFPGKAQRGMSVQARSVVISPMAGEEVRFDPRASLVLKRMGEAYSRLGACDLHIAISSALIPLDAVPDSTALSTTNVNPTPFHVDESTLRPQTQLHLAFRQSNRLLMDTVQPDPVTGKNYDLRWVCDGQYFWSYTGSKNIYTREKAPSNIHDFSRLEYLNSGTLELILLIGPNPFADLQQSVDSAHMADDALVRGIPTEVVRLQFETPLEKSEIRLYIGKADSLLYRMEIASIPITPYDGPIKVGSKLDGLLDASKPKPSQQDYDPSNPGMPDPSAQPPPKPHKSFGSFTRFENDLDLSPSFANDTFTFTPPKGSLMLGGVAGPVKRLTMKQRIAMLAKNARQQRDEMLRNGQN